MTGLKLLSGQKSRTMPARADRTQHPSQGGCGSIPHHRDSPLQKAFPSAQGGIIHSGGQCVLQPQHKAEQRGTEL